MLLTEREKETLRLLLVGHDAKSIARQLGLSVHTVNERLRDARRKLGVSSSREAARRLAAVEETGPQRFADKDFGVVSGAADANQTARPITGGGVGQPLAWLGGGMIVMSLIVVAIALSSSLHAGGDGGQLAKPALVPVAAASSAAPTSAGAKSALSWTALVDGGHWAESWDAAGSLFKSSLSKAQWATTIAGVRGPLGAVTSRTLQTDNRTSTLPNAPPGEYEILQFQTNFAQKPAAIETVILAQEGESWRVVGYFIR